MEIRRLKTILVVLQVFPLIASLAIATAASTRRSGAPEDDRIFAAALAIVYIPHLASVALSGVLAARMKRSVTGWVLTTFLLPVIGPLILASRRSLDPPSRAAAPASAAPPAPDPAAADAPADTPGGFCTKCLAETTGESPGNMTTFNGIGTTLMGTRWRARGLHRCPACGSVVQTKWFTFGFGVKALGTFRVIYTKRGLTTSRLFARRLRDDPVAR